MFFRRGPPQDDMILAQFPNPKVGDLTANNVLIAKGDASTVCSTSPMQASRSSATPTTARSHRRPLDRSLSSEYFLEIKRSPGWREPLSRKTDFATIRTEATDETPAFESDAFAVQMPTTREPILDAPIYRAKIPSPSRAQRDAYDTYKQKAQQVRERNNSSGVRVPSKIVSYDLATSSDRATKAPSELHMTSTPIHAPHVSAPAGAFPITPPLPLQPWTRVKEPCQPIHKQGQRSVSDSSKISIARKPIGLGKSTTLRTHPQYQQGDADGGASRCSATSFAIPTRIRVRVKPKEASDKDEHSSRKEEPWWSLVKQSPQSSTNPPRSPSPTKSTKSIYTVPHVPEPAFGHGRHESIRKQTVAAKTKREHELEKDVPPKRTSADRWAWLRFFTPKGNAADSTPVQHTAYIDPFAMHATPPPSRLTTPISSRPSSPQKGPVISMHKIPSTYKAKQTKGEYESGIEQVTSLGSILVRACLVIYALFALYFLLDAIREAVHTLGAPFRLVQVVLGYGWMAGAFLAKLLTRAWQKWGLRIAWRGGWYGRWWS